MRWALATVLLIACIDAYPPRIVQRIPTVAVEGGSAFSYEFNASSFATNKVDGLLHFSLASTDAAALPVWASFAPGSRTLAGDAPDMQDLAYNWTLSATDRDGQQSSQTFLFVISVACPTQQYRHFRFQGRGADASLSGGGNSLAAFLVCSISWDYGDPANSFPSSTAAAEVNISGTRAEPGGTDFHRAFQRLLQPLSPPWRTTYPCNDWADAWQVQQPASLLVSKQV